MCPLVSKNLVFYLFIFSFSFPSFKAKFRCGDVEVSVLKLFECYIELLIRCAYRKYWKIGLPRLTLKFAFVRLAKHGLIY